MSPGAHTPQLANPMVVQDKRQLGYRAIKNPPVQQATFMPDTYMGLAPPYGSAAVSDALLQYDPRSPAPGTNAPYPGYALPRGAPNFAQGQAGTEQDDGSTSATAYLVTPIIPHTWLPTIPGSVQPSSKLPKRAPRASNVTAYNGGWVHGPNGLIGSVTLASDTNDTSGAHGLNQEQPDVHMDDASSSNQGTSELAVAGNLLQEDLSQQDFTQKEREVAEILATLGNVNDGQPAKPMEATVPDNRAWYRGADGGAPLGVNDGSSPQRMDETEFDGIDVGDHDDFPGENGAFGDEEEFGAAYRASLLPAFEERHRLKAATALWYQRKWSPRGSLSCAVLRHMWHKRPQALASIHSNLRPRNTPLKPSWQGPVVSSRAMITTGPAPAVYVPGTPVAGRDLAGPLPVPAKTIRGVPVLKSVSKPSVSEMLQAARKDTRKVAAAPQCRTGMQPPAAPTTRSGTQSASFGYGFEQLPSSTAAHKSHTAIKSKRARQEVEGTGEEDHSTQQPTRKRIRVARRA